MSPKTQNHTEYHRLGIKMPQIVLKRNHLRECEVANLLEGCCAS